MSNRRRCTVCGIALEREEAVAWADSGLPVRHMACGRHLEVAKFRLREERDGVLPDRRLAELEAENQRLRERTRHLASAMTDMAELVNELTEKLKAKEE